MRRQPPSSSGTGFAEDEKAMELSAWPSLTFPDINPTISKEVKASVARLHVNAGHPNNQELKRLLATHGSINSQVLTAIEHLRCGSCIRTSRPTPPRSASMPAFTLQLGERIQADIVWVRDMTGQNFPVLGVVCVATNFQVAARPASRSSAHCLDTLRTMWLVPFGYPLAMDVDDDGCFGGALKHTWKRRLFTSTLFPRRRTCSWHMPSGATLFCAPWPSA